MFAFVIWDKAERRAFGARDPFGIKPLFYLQTTDGLYLASEKKALMPFAPAAWAGDAGIDHGQPVALPDPAVRARADHAAQRYQPGRVRASPSPTARANRSSCRRYYRADFRPAPVSDEEALYKRIRGDAAGERPAAHAL